MGVGNAKTRQRLGSQDQTKKQSGMWVLGEEAILDILSYVGPPGGTRSQLSTGAFPLFSFWASPRPLGATARLRQLPGLQAASSTVATGSFLLFLHTPLGECTKLSLMHRQLLVVGFQEGQGKAGMWEFWVPRVG